MGRDLFHPGEAAGAKPPPPPGARRARSGTDAEVALTVGQACEQIRRVLENHLPSPLHVRGEVSGLRTPGHWYFNLKDEEGVLSCVAWRSSAARFDFVPVEGEEVVVTGSVSHYAPQGRTQFYVTRVRRVGGGALRARFEALCAELRQLSYFNDELKRPLPPFPRRVAVLTSAHGAAVHDVIDTARRRWPAVGLVIVDVRVQGDGAAEDVARALRAVDRLRETLRIDAVIVTRGGGSVEDLWAFNERILADVFWDPVRRRRLLSLPVVAAIGHESDITIIELVADRRAATPTQATMMLIPAREELHRQVNHLADRLRLLTCRRIERARERLAALARHDAVRRPHAVVERARERVGLAERQLQRALRASLAARRHRLSDVCGRLERVGPRAATAQGNARVDALRLALRRGLRTAIARTQARLVAAERHLRALDPEDILRRGYSLTTRGDGSLVRTVNEVRPGDRLVTRVADGSIDSVVEATGPAERDAAGSNQIADPHQATGATPIGPTSESLRPASPAPPGRRTVSGANLNRDNATDPGLFH